jgi:hypothetical protein
MRGEQIHQGLWRLKRGPQGLQYFHNTALIHGAAPRPAQGWHSKKRGHDDEGIEWQATRLMVLFSQPFTGWQRGSRIVSGPPERAGQSYEGHNSRLYPLAPKTDFNFWCIHAQPPSCLASRISLRPDTSFHEGSSAP